MGIPTLIKNSFASGEISPSLYARTDLDKYHTGAALLRNCYVDYRGGTSNRPGTQFVGQTKYAPPYITRLINFQFSVLQSYVLELGYQYMRIIFDGGYVLETAINLASVSYANPGVFTTTAPHGYAVGDWIFASGFTTATGLENKTFIVASVLTSTTFTVTDLYGNPLNTSAMIIVLGAANVSRYYTVATPWLDTDLALLKFTQSADVISFTHPNYTPIDITRTGNTAWTVTPTTFAADIAAPVATVCGASTAGSTTYSYYVTAVSADGEESVASNVVQTNSADISTTAGYLYVEWNPVAAAQSYNVYRAPIAIAGSAAYAGQIFGFVGSTVQATSPIFYDNNISPDFTDTAPTHQNPFASGNNPGVVSYFQQRKTFAASTLDPETLWFTQPGAFQNMDYRIPTKDDDSINVTLSSQQVNAIKHLVSMPSGLIVLTGSGAWQVSGGSPGVAITPSNIVAVPQAYNGCSDVPPIVINYDILFVQEKQSIVRDLSYNYFINIYTGDDITVLSNHLFSGYQIMEWTWAEEPNKLVWAVRSDGVLLSLTYLKEQQVQGWTHHDTNGLFKSVASISENQENAVYFVVQRYVNGNWLNYTERLSTRQMPNGIEDAWFVDAGRQYSLNYPAATAQLSAANGTQNLTAAHIVNGGAGYTAPIVIINDPTGIGAVATATIAGGVITGIVYSNNGSGYTNPSFTITDPTGSGAIITPIITNYVTLTASAAVFTNAMVGWVMRCGGALGTVVTYNSTTSLTVNLQNGATDVLANDPNNTPIPQTSGNWSLTQPVTQVFGMDHLIGKTVAILADGNVVSNQVVAADGSITLAVPATLITIGLPFQAQIQTLYIEQQNAPTIQGKRKKITAVSVRVMDTRGIKAGSRFDSLAENKAWSTQQNPKQPLPLYTGDQRIVLDPNWTVQGQICIQQDYPLPVTVLGLIPEFSVGDT